MSFVGGFDLELGHLTLVEGNWSYALSWLRTLRRRALRDCAGMSAERQGADRSALECLRGLVLASALASDTRSGARFAKQFAAEDPSSWSFIALGLFEEHREQRGYASRAYGEAARLARKAGDLHHIQQAYVGLARLDSLHLLRVRTDRQKGLKWLKAYPVRPPLTHIEQLLGLYWLDVYRGGAARSG